MDMITHDCCGCRAQAEVDSLVHVEGSSHPASDDHQVSCQVCMTRCQVGKDQHAVQHWETSCRGRLLALSF